MIRLVITISSLVALAATMTSCGDRQAQPTSNLSSQGNAVDPPSARAPGKDSADNVGDAHSNAAVAPAPRGDLSRYIDQYPVTSVEGMAFLADPLVTKAVSGAVTDQAIRAFVLNPRQTSTPISRNDGMIVASGCERHNCGDHNWTMAITPDASQLELCVFDSAVDPKNGRIFSLSGKSVPRPGNCWQ